MRQNWSKERIIETIRQRHEQGLTLVGLQKSNRGLRNAARRYFGTWEQAVAAAGIPPSWKHRWRQEEFLELLRRYAQPGVRLSSARVPDVVLTVAYR
jgi:hypothetical protein